MERARRARRARAGVGRQHAAEHDAADRPGADEFPVPPSAQPDAAQRRRDRRRRRHRRPRDRQFLRRDQHVSRPDRAQLAAGHEDRRQARHDQRGRAQLQGELPGFPALLGSRSGAGRRRRGDAALADRGGEAADHRRSQARVRGTRRQAGRGEPGGQGTRAHRCDLRLGRGPDQHRAAGGGSLGAGPEGRLVARERRAQWMGAASVEFREVLPVHRRLGRIGHRLRRAGGRGRRARQPASTAGCRSASRTTAT